MRKLSINRIKLMLVAALVAIAFACVGFMTFAKAENTFTSLADIDVTMDGYALIVEGEDGINGLEFTISAPQAQYSAMVGSVGEGKAYASVETGIIIAPAYYNDEIAINQDSLFNSPEYDWANYVDGEWVYSGDKIQVININANDWVDLGDTVTYSGGIVDIRPENENVAMYSVGYIKLVDSEGVATYKFTDSSEISVVAAAVQAYDSLSGSQKIWVDTNWLDVLPIIEEDVVLKDVAGAATYNVLDTVIANAGVKNIMDGFTSADGLSATMTDSFGNVVDINLENPVVDVTADLLRVWDIEIKAGEFVLYQGTADLYDSSAKPVWTDLSTTAGIGAYYGNDQTKEMIAMKTIGSQATTFDGKAALEISSLITHADKTSSETFINVAPIHTKDYYAQYVDMGIAFNYSYYYTVDADFSGEGLGPVDSNGNPTNLYAVNQHSHYAKGGRDTGGYKASDAFFNRWYDVSVPLDALVSDWDNIVNLKDASYSWGNYNLGLVFALTSNLGALGGMEEIGLKLYLAGFTFDVDLSLLPNGGEVLVELDDVADKTALDLTKFLPADDVAMLNAAAEKATLSYELKGYSIADTIAVTDLTAVDVSSAKEAAYILTVSTGGFAIYTATIDLYTSTSPVVWAESMTAENVVLRKVPATSDNIAHWLSSNATLMEEGEDYVFVDSVTVGEKTYEGSFVKVIVKEISVVAFDVKALHTKAYYQEMSDLTKVLHIRGYFPSSVSTDQHFGSNNYGMNDKYSTWRKGLAGNTYESIVISMDNYLIASDNSTVPGKFYNWDGVYSDKTGTNTMIQFEIPASKATADAPFEFYLGNLEVVQAGETLVSDANKYVNTTIDLSGEVTSFDLVDVIPEAQRAKLVAMAKAWGQSAGKHTASAVGFNLTVNGVTHSVKPNEEGRFIVNLDDTIVNKDGTLLEGYQVRDILVAGNNSVSITGYAPPVLSMGVSSWPVTMAVTGTLTIVGPAAAAE